MEKEIKFDKFDRKKFDPEKNDKDLSILYKLRNKGWTRRVAFRVAKDNNFKDQPTIAWAKYNRLQSSAMFDLRHVLEPFTGIDKSKPHYKNKVFCDFGCGQSPDVVIALELGFKKAYAIDLFKVRTNWEKGVEFLQQDICEKLSLKDNSIDHAICQAVIDLIKPEERILFYKNAYRILKPNGCLAIYIINLHVGYGHNILREIENCMDAGFSLENKSTQGFVVRKIK